MSASSSAHNACSKKCTEMAIWYGAAQFIFVFAFGIPLLAVGYSYCVLEERLVRVLPYNCTLDHVAAEEVTDRCCRQDVRPFTIDPSDTTWDIRKKTHQNTYCAVPTYKYYAMWAFYPAAGPLSVATVPTATSAAASLGSSTTSASSYVNESGYLRTSIFRDVSDGMSSTNDTNNTSVLDLALLASPADGDNNGTTRDTQQEAASGAIVRPSVPVIDTLCANRHTIPSIAEALQGTHVCYWDSTAYNNDDVVWIDSIDDKKRARDHYFLLLTILASVAQASYLITVFLIIGFSVNW